MTPQNQSPATILVVDDDEAVRHLLRDILHREGYCVDTAANGREALTRVAERQYDLVITDLVMPEQEGIETIQQLRQEYPQVKVIAVSGAFGGDYLRVARHLGAQSTIQKPIQIQQLLDAVRSAVS